PSTRSSVVFPDPDGPSKETNAPCGAVKLTPFKAPNSPKFLTNESTISDMASSLMMVHGGDFVRIAPFQNGFDDQRHERQQRQERGHGKRPDILIVFVERLDMERHSIRHAANAARDDRHRAELAHRARVA